MKRIIEIISWLSLALLVLAPALFYAEKITLEKVKLLMLAATVIWFASASFWMGTREKGASQ